jgi:hypothetical protein
VWVRVVVGLATAVCTLAVIYVVVRLTGVPGWVPGTVTQSIPGL